MSRIRKKDVKDLIDRKRSQQIQKDIFEGSENQDGMMWKSIKRNLNWTEGGPPTALRDNDGKVQMKPEKVAERYH